MEYFFYTDLHTVIKFNNGIATFFPDRPSWGCMESAWMRRYEDEKKKRYPELFRICENQAKKFMEKGTIPINVDW